jgi:hypothetical protein
MRKYGWLTEVFCKCNYQLGNSNLTHDSMKGYRIYTCPLCGKKEYDKYISKKFYGVEK